MISKFRFSLITLLLLVLFGFGLQDQAKGQPGVDNQFCPGVPFPNGWIDTEITPVSTAPPDFSAALIGTVETFDGVRLVAGLDWMHQGFDLQLAQLAAENQARQFDIDDFIISILQATRPTNQVGSQLVTWWSQKDGRNTFVQVTNYNGGPQEDIFGTLFVNVHVRILDENCDEIRDFCDIYTEGDTHVYNLGDLVDNEGDTPDDTILQGREGFLVVTPVDDCPSPDIAIDYNYMAGNMYMLDANNYLYGVNTYARAGVCIPEFDNIINNGSFQDELFFGWSERQTFTSAATESDFSPFVPVPTCDDLLNPDCSDPDADVFQALVASDAAPPDGIGSDLFYGESGVGGIFTQLANSNLIGQGTETNVSVLQSDIFPVPSDGGILGNECIDSDVAYDIQVFNPSDLQVFAGCDNYTAVCLIDVDAVPFFKDCDIYNVTGDGQILQNSTFGPIVGTALALGDDNLTYNFTGTTLEFQGGKSALVQGTLDTDPGNSYVIQVITGQEAAFPCSSNTFFEGGIFGRGTNGAVVDNFRLICVGDNCDDVGDGLVELNGLFSFLLPVTPDKVAGQFNAPTGAAGADVVHINFLDDYLPNYRPLAAFIDAQVGIWDEFEEFTSCGDARVCFARLGIDAALVLSDDFVAPTIPPTIGPPPTLGPTLPPPTATPTNTGSGGSSSCAIAGNPIQLGTAMANVLIPLIPVAFAFGVRAVRRRKK